MVKCSVYSPPPTFFFPLARGKCQHSCNKTVVSSIIEGRLWQGRLDQMAPRWAKLNQCVLQGSKDQGQENMLCQQLLVCVYISLNLFFGINSLNPAGNESIFSKWQKRDLLHIWFNSEPSASTWLIWYFSSNWSY